MGGSLETVIDGETGFLVDVQNQEGMAKILRSALSNIDKLHKIGDKGRTHVHNNFTTEMTCRAEWQSYITILGQE